MRRAGQTRKKAHACLHLFGLRTALNLFDPERGGTPESTMPAQKYAPFEAGALKPRRSISRLQSSASGVFEQSA
jgi:hypothetical protein